MPGLRPSALKDQRYRLIGMISLACAGCDDRGQVLGLAPPPPPGAPPAAMDLRVVAAGSEHACAIRAGLLVCWGQNASGQVGGSSALELTPRVVGTASSWEDVAVGESSSCAKQKNGQAWCWGDNRSGQLGTSDLVSGPTPRLVVLPGAAQALSMKFSHACALLKDNTLWCWGDNAEGQLGQGGTYPGQPEPTPKVVPAPGAGWSWVSTGQGHTCAITLEGALYCWGRNTQSQLGIGPDPGQVRQPVQVGSALDWREVATGQFQTCGIRSAGELWCWGLDVNGSLGFGIENQAVDTPRRLTNDADFEHVSLENFHTCVVRSPGRLWCWGRSIEGQLGVAATAPRLTPAAVDTAMNWQTVAVGRFFTCAWKNGQGLLCMGANESGQLGVGDTSRRSEPSAVALGP